MSAITTAQKAPVDATSRMNSIISSTGMPRRNSMSHPVGMRSHAMRRAAHEGQHDAQGDRADGGDGGGLQGGNDAAADRAPQLGVEEDVPPGRRRTCQEA